MKKILMIFAIIATIGLTSCADSKTIDGITYETYGLVNEDEVKNDSIYYRMSGQALFSGIFWCETIVTPIWVFGYSLYEPRMTMKQFRELKAQKNGTTTSVNTESTFRESPEAIVGEN